MSRAKTPARNAFSVASGDLVLVQRRGIEEADRVAHAEVLVLGGDVVLGRRRGSPAQCAQSWVVFSSARRGWNGVVLTTAEDLLRRPGRLACRVGRGGSAGGAAGSFGPPAQSAVTGANPASANKAATSASWSPRTRSPMGSALYFNKWSAGSDIAARMARRWRRCGSCSSR